MDNRHQPPAPRRDVKKRGRPELIVVFLVMLSVAFLILKEEVPQVEDWYQRLINEEKWSAGVNCRRAAIEAAKQSDFARIVDNGTVNSTENGYFIDGIVVGEMSDSGAEDHFGYSCYTKADGDIVKSGKASLTLPPHRTPPPEETVEP
jgi:hypothetical protein